MESEENKATYLFIKIIWLPLQTIYRKKKYVIELLSFFYWFNQFKIKVIKFNDKFKNFQFFQSSNTRHQIIAQFFIAIFLYIYMRWETQGIYIYVSFQLKKIKNLFYKIQNIEVVREEQQQRRRRRRWLPKWLRRQRRRRRSTWRRRSRTIRRWIWACASSTRYRSRK